MSKTWHLLRPLVPDNAAAGSVFIGSDALVAFNDFSGSVVCLRFFLDIGQTNTPFRTTREAEEGDYVFGNYHRFVESYRRMLADDPRGALVIVDGPVSSLIALDLEHLAHMAHEELQLPVVTVAADGYGTYDHGLSQAMLALYRHVASSAAEQEGAAAGTGVLGLDWFDFYCEEYRSLVRGIVERSMGDVCACWGCEGDWNVLARSVRAARNVVVSASGMALARIMERERGIPYQTLDACMEGARGQLDACGASVVVVGDQVLGNCVRTLLAPGNANVRVATFGTLHDSCALPGDAHLEDELDYMAFLQDTAPRLVVGDATLRRATPPSTAFFDFDNFAFFRRVPERYGYAYDDLPLSDEWMQHLASVLRQLDE